MEELPLPDKRSCLKEAIRIAWPSVVESLFIALASVIDSFMVSRLGPSAVAAVGLTNQPKFLSMALYFATCTAVSALVARRYGEKRREDANRIVITASVFTLITVVFITAAGLKWINEIVRFCGSNEDTHEQAVTYFRVILAGTVFNAVQININSAQRGVGNTRITMVTHLVSSTVNICFNYFLIEGHCGFPRLEIYGAALATVIGSAVACCLSIASLFKKDGFLSVGYAIREKLKADMKSLKAIARVGYSLFLEQIMLRIGFLTCSIISARQGTEAYAAHQATINLLNISFALGDGLQLAAVALIGRSLGEGRPNLAKRYSAYIRRMGLVGCTVLSIGIYFGSRLLFEQFFEDGSIVDISVKLSYFCIPILFEQVMNVIFFGSLRGAGDTLYTAIVSMICVTFIRTSMAWFFAIYLAMGIYGVWTAMLLELAIRLTLAMIRFFRGKWITIKI